MPLATNYDRIGGADRFNVGSASVGPGWRAAALEQAEETLIRLHDARAALRALPRTMARLREDGDLTRRLLKGTIGLARVQRLNPDEPLRLKDERVARLVARVVKLLPPVAQIKPEIVPGSERLTDYSDKEFDAEDDPFVDESWRVDDMVRYLCGQQTNIAHSAGGWRRRGEDDAPAPGNDDDDDDLDGDGDEAVGDEVECCEASD